MKIALSKLLFNANEALFNLSKQSFTGLCFFDKVFSPSVSALTLTVSIIAITDVIKKFLIKQSKSFRVKGNFLTVGSSHFRNIKKKYSVIQNNKKKLRICLVLDPINNDLDNFGNNHETYIRALKTVQIFANSKNHILFIKTFKNVDENLELFKSIKKNKWNNVKILNVKKKIL